jgi:hypothetical protein
MSAKLFTAVDTVERKIVYKHPLGPEQCESQEIAEALLQQFNDNVIQVVAV